MSVDPGVDPQLAHRLLDPRAWEAISALLIARAKTRPVLPATFRGPNWNKES
ncbi:hypothetical protein PXH67_06180 [Streptomyces sp. P8-A8]|uniref:hypothetical protein n=1 Tax=Streptomyces sp. P8-A8 TaxID=3029759 RepID=UPI0036DD67E1